MDMRTRIGDALKDAMKSKDAARLSTLRLINAAIKDKDVALRGEAEGNGVGDDEVLGILGKMVKQRQESARAYEEGGRLDLAERELAEIGVIEEFLPRQLDEDEVIAVCAENLAGYKKPRSVEFVDELPKTGSGKIMRRMLRDRYWEGQERRIG